MSEEPDPNDLKVPEIEELDSEIVPEPTVDDSSLNGESLDSLREEREELRDRWLRKEADIQNLRKRVSREKAELAEAARRSVLQAILPVIDSSEKGIDLMESQAISEDLKVYHEGIKLLVNELKNVLEKFEVLEVPGIGHPFDPGIHEAILVEQTDDHTEGEVLELYRKGYIQNGRLLRPAQVKVASAILTDSEQED